MTSSKPKNYTQIASDKLQGRTVTCAGCCHRILFGLSAYDGSEKKQHIWSEHCAKRQKLPENHTRFEKMTDTSTSFQTICPEFLGSYVADNDGGPVPYQDSPVQTFMAPDIECRVIYADNEEGKAAMYSFLHQINAKVLIS